MKVTVELPDDIFVRFQAAASFRHISLSELLTQALQRELGVTAQSTADKCYELDEYAWPVLNHDLFPKGPVVAGREFSNFCPPFRFGVTFDRASPQPDV